MSSEASLERHERPSFLRRVGTSCMKAAFSQVGLVVLVIIYVLLGALLFEYLESGPNLEKRSAIQRSRDECLKELWAITGSAKDRGFYYQIIEDSN
ncbi:unnamed protein product [Leptosia nina]|uniref:Uncharacterized protein n=1 Tax=Leptosia nina TaxID=320188 RepID=A0AAV1K7U0_9NEOP